MWGAPYVCGVVLPVFCLFCPPLWGFLFFFLFPFLLGFGCFPLSPLSLTEDDMHWWSFVSVVVAVVVLGLGVSTRRRAFKAHHHGT